MANKLVLRVLKSPWITPVPDLTKGSVLTHAELDDNFIYLKGEIISGVTVDNGIVTLHKLNGETFFYDNHQNNLINFREYNTNNDSVTISDLVNLDPNGLIIDDKTIFILKKIYNFTETIYFFAKGKGEWGASLLGGTSVTENDFIEITNSNQFWESGNGVYSLIGKNDTNNAANGNYSFVQGYNSSTEGDNSAILGGGNNTILSSAHNSVILGGENITATTSNTVYLPNLNITNITESFSGETILSIDDDGSVTSFNNENISKTIYVTSIDIENCNTCTGSTVEERIVQYINTLNYYKTSVYSDVWVEYNDINGPFTLQFNNVFL